MSVNRGRRGDESLPPALLQPIGGVDLPTYVSIVRGLAAHGYDPTHLAEIAASHEVASDDWASAQSGWAARIRTHEGLAQRFTALYLDR